MFTSIRMRVAVLLATGATLTACHRGASSETAGAAPKPAAAPATPPEVTPSTIAQGDSLFNTGTCQRCHGKGGTGGRNGPDLTTGPFLHSPGKYADIVNTITTGVPKTALKDPARPFAMNPRGGGQNPLNDAQIKLVAAYVYSISRNKK